MNTVVVVGSINMDVVARVPQLPRPAETVPGTSVAMLPGGKGANQAVAARRAGDCPVRIIGALGDDDFARGLRSFLKAQDVDASAVDSVSGPSGTALVTVDAQGGNTVVVVAGANARVSEAAAAALKVSAGDVVVMQNEIPDVANHTAIETARSAGASTVFNLAPYRPPAHDTEVDHLVANEVEFAQLVGMPLDSVSPATVAAALHRYDGPARNVVVTLGADGVVARLAGSILTTPGHDVPVTDTTGAGDVFCGAFAAHLAEGKAADQALRWANAAAALSVGRPGAGPSAPGRAEVRAFLAAERSRAPHGR